MRRRALVMMAAMGTAAWAAEPGGAEARNVTVCMGGDSDLPPIYPVMTMASEILVAGGVRLVWRTGACPATSDAIRIGFADRAPERVSAGALAYSLPYEGTHIVILYARVKRHGAYAQQLLAYVLVHEITHILQGTSRHSNLGIMKAQWDYADYSKMRRKALVLAAEDVDLIHRGLDAREARMAGKGPVQVAAQ